MSEDDAHGLTRRAFTGGLGTAALGAAVDPVVAVEMGTSLSGLALTRASPSPTPDYAVFDESMRYRGSNGRLATGVFDTAWTVDPALGHHRDVQ
jgi:hypothetical protein